MGGGQVAGEAEKDVGKPAVPDLREGEIFRVLKDVGSALRSLLGRSCEVVIHDTRNLENSIVWIEGDVTGRSVGGVMTDLGLERLHEGKMHPLFNYTTHTASGKHLRSASIWLRDADGEIFGALCINLDVTPIAVMQGLVRDLAPDESRPDLREEFAADLGDMIDMMIAECEYRLGCGTEEMSKDQRIAVVRFLDERGCFQVRNSASIVASRLGVSRKTVYNYLSEIESEREAAIGSD
jgi:predicted transcriptional regulator YheO